MSAKKKPKTKRTARGAAKKDVEYDEEGDLIVRPGGSMEPPPPGTEDKGESVELGGSADDVSEYGDAEPCGKGASQGSKKGKGRRKKKKRKGSSSSSSDDDKKSKKRRHRSPSSSSSSESSSSSTSEPDSDWEDFLEHPTMVKVRELLKSAPPRLPRDVLKGPNRFAIDGRGDVLVVKRPVGRKEKWMRESKGQRSDRYSEYHGAMSRLSHTGGDKVLRRNFNACVRPMKAVEKVLLSCPLGLAGGARRALVEARGILFERLDLLQIERETNATIAGFVETKRSKGGERDLNAAIEKFAKLERARHPSGRGRGGGQSGGAGGRDRRAYKPFVPAATPSSFPVYLPPTPSQPSYGYGQRGPPAPRGACFDCLELGHRKGDAICKGKK
jgi:hypothetical protein